MQIFLRLSIKMDYQFTDFITPVELHKIFDKAEKLEEEKKKSANDPNIAT